MPIPVPVASDGFCHPGTEEEIVALVRWCHHHRCQMRVRGSAHSFPRRSIFTDRPAGRSPAEVNVMLDRYRALRWLEQDVVEVEAGCHLSFDPHDPTHLSRVETGLLYQLQKKGLALDDLGGISHQTVGGFLSTGSSGGSVRFGIDDDIVKIRFIDGTGVVHEVSRIETEREVFEAVGVSMGLLGVISKVTFRCRPTFNIVGTETTTGVNECEIDLFGDGQAGKLSLESFLRQTDYTRLMWWPQPGVERVVLWKADRQAPPLPPSNFVPVPYRELGRHPLGSEVLGGLLLSIIGNLDELASLPQRIEPIFEQLDAALIGEIERLPVAPRTARALSHLVSRLLEAGVDGVLDFPGIYLLAWLLRKSLPALVPAILNAFNPLDREKKPPGPQMFQDYWWSGLPMDNEIDDRLMPVWFTEIWIPISRTKDVMCRLRDFFQAGGLTATGTLSFEIYAAKKSPFWMSPACRGPAIRVDVFWFGYNAQAPDAEFFPRFWNLLKDFAFSPHWGKFLPRDPPPSKVWARHFGANHPRWKDFLAWRQKLDPRNIFLTRYWREHLGLEDAQPIQPVPAPPPPRDPFDTPSWAAARRSVSIFSWALLAASVYAVVAAHLPFLVGHPWSNCQPPQTQFPQECVIAYHALEGPFVAYLFVLSWIGLRGLRPQPGRYAVHLSFGIGLLAVFALFQFVQIADNLRRAGPRWEVDLLYSFGALMGLGIVLGLYTRIKLAMVLEPVRHRRRGLPWGW